MGHEFTERRRSPRVAAEGGSIWALHVSVPIRLIDVSSDGLLLASASALRVGSTIRVAAELGGERLEVELCVRHVSGQRDEAAGGYVAGGSFPSYDQRARRTVAALLDASGLGAAAAPVAAFDRGRWNPPARDGHWRDRRTRRRERPGPGPAAWGAPSR